MELRFSPLFSGSSGNALYVGCDGAHLLVDAGVSGTRVAQSLAGIDVQPGELNGILVTHEHIDHIRGIGVLSRKYDLPIFATPGTWAAMSGKIGAVAEKNVRVFDPEVNFFMGPIEVVAFPTPHDAAEPVGFAFELDGARLAVATDIGCVRDSWAKYVLGADAAVLESNYDPDMLDAGPYPYELKKRIRSRRGHLSNDDAGGFAVRLIEQGTRQIVLGHLSKENNFPELALKCTECALRQAGIEPNQDARVCVAQRDMTTGIYSVRSEFR